MEKESLKNTFLNNKHEKTQISKEVEDAFIKLVQTELYYVEQLSNLSDNILKCKEFTTYDAYKAIDSINERHISENNLNTFLTKNGLKLSYEEIQNIIFRLDLDGDKVITYDEFQELFFPVSLRSSKISLSSSQNLDSLRYSSSYFVSTSQSGNLKKSNDVAEKEQVQEKEQEIQQATPSKNLKEFDDRVRQSSNRKEMMVKAIDNKISPSRERHYPNNISDLSPSRSSRFDELNLRASKQTYTSPLRMRSDERQYFEESKSPIKYSNDYQISKSGKKENDTFYSATLRSPYLKDFSTYSLSKYFNDVMAIDAKTEVFRESLAAKPEVNLKDLFRIFDVSGKCCITVNDFREALKQFDVFFPMNDLKLVFKRYDNNMDGKIE
jgi:Ca2+-binding EF-hand superfamily protein